MKGEVRIEQILEQDEVFQSGRAVVISGEPNDRRTEIEYFRRQHGRCIIKLRGVDSISEAERVVGSEIKIAANTLPALKHGWFYTFDLKGCEVFTTGAEYIGRVTGFLAGAGTEILKVDRDDQETLIPFADEYVKHVDIEHHRIEVVLPADLRDLNK